MSAERAQERRRFGVRQRRTCAIPGPSASHRCRRSEETNATRSLLNTAKIMAENPVMLRLKELEALEKIAARSRG
jgi:hypothetical protein